MKKTLLISLAALLTGSAAFAEGEETPAKFKLYGFIRNYTIVDTREVKAGTNDLYFYMPQDVIMAADGTTDLNKGINWRSLSLTTRLGLDVSGYQFGSMKLGGKVEADFYSLNGTGTAQTIAQLRLRQAFVALGWDFSEGNHLGLTIGQAWHPMAADMPHMTNLETGAPFNPFNRSPQMMLSYTTAGWTFTGGLLYLNHYLPMDAQGGGKSVAPFKYGLPEAYAGVSFKSGPVLARVGVDILNTKPFRTYNEEQNVLNSDGTPKLDGEGKPETRTVIGGKVKSLMTAVSPFVFFQYTKGMFQLRAKSILAQSGEHLNLLSGYGINSYDMASHSYTYTPMQTSASFISFQYGKKFQVMMMAGYFKQLGTTKELNSPQNLYINTAADTKIQQAVRATPTVAWNIGKFTVSLEYNVTAAQFGEGQRDARGMFSQYHWVLNHRFINMVKFNF